MEFHLCAAFHRAIPVIPIWRSLCTGSGDSTKLQGKMRNDPQPWHRHVHLPCTYNVNAIYVHMFLNVVLIYVFFLSFLVNFPEGLSVYHSCTKVCSDGMSCSLWTSITSRFAHQEPARLLQFPRVFYEIHPETGKMRWERSQWKVCGDFGQISIRPRIASCKVKALEQCRRCKDVVELLLYSLHNLQKQNSYQRLESEGIKNLYLLCKGRAVGKGQLVAIRNCRSVFLFAGMFAFVVASSESRSQTNSKNRGKWGNVQKVWIRIDLTDLPIYLWLGG